MKPLLFAALSLTANAGLILNPVSAINHNGFELHAPGVVLNLPELWTYRPIGSPDPDFGTCGQVGFISTLEDGSPDPNANPAFLQINSGCPSPIGEALVDNAEFYTEEPEQPTGVPEPSTGTLIGSVAAGLLLVAIFRKLL